MSLAKGFCSVSNTPTIITSLFGWLVGDGWCWFVLREEYCWLVVGGWFVPREKYCWLVADKPSEQAVHRHKVFCSISNTPTIITWSFESNIVTMLFPTYGRKPPSARLF
jgi:hypothetical protein